MHVGTDLDGTLDSDPVNMGSLLCALRAAGHHVTVLTSAGTPNPTHADLDEKVTYLRSLGLGSAWDTLVVMPWPPAKHKARWCRKHDVDILIDNNSTNAQLASESCTVLVPWNSIVPQSLRDEVDTK